MASMIAGGLGEPNPFYTQPTERSNPVGCPWIRDSEPQGTPIILREKEAGKSECLLVTSKIEHMFNMKVC